jgi:hypothetical protein
MKTLKHNTAFSISTTHTNSHSNKVEISAATVAGGMYRNLINIANTIPIHCPDDDNKNKPKKTGLIRL